MALIQTDVDKVNIFSVPVDNVTIQGGTNSNDALHVIDDSITNDKIADGAILNSKIATGAVTLPNLADGTPNTLIGYGANGAAIGIATNETLEIANGIIKVVSNGGTTDDDTLEGDGQNTPYKIKNVPLNRIESIGTGTILANPTITDNRPIPVTLGAGLTFNNNRLESTASGAGEANTAINVGGGVNIFKQKTGADLELKTASNGYGTSTRPDGDNFVFDLDIDGLIEATEISANTDYIVFRDTSVATGNPYKKIKPENLGIGGGSSATSSFTTLQSPTMGAPSVFVKYSGIAPTFTGIDGEFLLSVPTTCDLKSWQFHIGNNNSSLNGSNVLESFKVHFDNTTVNQSQSTRVPSNIMLTTPTDGNCLIGGQEGAYNYGLIVKEILESGDLKYTMPNGDSFAGVPDDGILLRVIYG